MIEFIQSHPVAAVGIAFALGISAGPLVIFAFVVAVRASIGRGLNL